MLVCAARTTLIPVSHHLPPRGYDEPESLSYAISSICPVSADGEHLISPSLKTGCRHKAQARRHTNHHLLRPQPHQK